jgi:nitrogen fixation protein NifB
MREAAPALLDAQARAIRALHQAGIYVKVNMTVYAGINEDHVPQLAQVVHTLGAELLALVPFHPTCTDLTGEKTAPKPPSAERMATLREQASRFIAVLPGNQTCSHTLAGMEPCLDPASASGPLAVVSTMPKPSGARINVAVASSSGLDVDLHLGQAIRFLIFGPRESDGLPSLLGSRNAPEPGGGDARWNTLAEVLHDCFALLAASAGAHPRELLASQGITVLTGEAEIQGAVDTLFGGGKKRGKKRIKAN